MNAIKTYAIGLGIGAAVMVGVAWAAKRATSNALDSAGNAISDGLGFVASLPGKAVDAVGTAGAAVGSAYNQGSTIEAENGATLADGNRSIFGIGDTGGTVSPYGSLGDWISAWLTGDPATSTTPAPLQIDYGTGDNNWND